MATTSKRKHRPGREDERRRLHNTVDSILDGANPNDVDGWVRETLVGIGLLIRAAQDALYYETGRVISGADRPHGYFPLASWEGALSWEGAAIDVDPQRTSKWIADGKAALETPQPVEKQQRALAALLRPIARISLYGPFEDLAEALDALPLGVVDRTVEPSPKKKLHGYGDGLKIWRVRKLALEWIEFQRHAKLMSKTGAEGEVANAFGIGVTSIKKEWKPKVKALFRKAVAEEGLKQAETDGRRYRELACDKLEKAAAARAWLAGNQRFMGLSARVGFHAASISIDNHAVNAKATDVVRDYMKALGFDQAAVSFMTDAPPSSMAWLYFSDADRLKIQVKQFSMKQPEWAWALAADNPSTPPASARIGTYLTGRPIGSTPLTWEAAKEQARSQLMRAKVPDFKAAD